MYLNDASNEESAHYSSLPFIGNLAVTLALNNMRKWHPMLVNMAVARAHSQPISSVAGIRYSQEGGGPTQAGGHEANGALNAHRIRRTYNGLTATYGHFKTHQPH